MFTHTYIEPYQVNSFIYCKRKWYYQNRLKFTIDNSDLELGKYIHETHWLKTAKRKEIYLISHKWKLKGICDYLIEEGEFQIPLELKIGKCSMKKPFKNDVMQLLCYILLLEDHFNVKYPYGYILYLGSKRQYKITITLTLRSNVQKCFKEIKSYMNNNKIPKRQINEYSCRKCSYREFCWCE